MPWSAARTTCRPLSQPNDWNTGLLKPGYLCNGSLVKFAEPYYFVHEGETPNASFGECFQTVVRNMKRIEIGVCKRRTFELKRIVLALSIAFIPLPCFSAVVVKLEAPSGAPAYGSGGVWDESNATIDLQVPMGDPGAVALEVTPIADPSLWWRMQLVGPDGQFPGPGNYSVQRYPLQESGFAGGDISNFNSCNAGHGNVEVYEIEYAPDGTIVRIAADLTYACTNSVVFAVAKLRIDSGVPLDQPGAHAVVVAEQIVTLGQSVALDGSASFSDSASITGYAWRQLEGEPVALVDAGSPIATFMFPDDKGDFQEMLFELAVSDDMGRSGLAQTLVVAGPVQSADTVRIFERGNNFVWTREIDGLGPNPTAPYTINGSALGGIFIRTVGPLLEIEPPLQDKIRIGGFTEAQRNGPISMFPGLTWFGCNYGPSDDIPYESYFDVLDVSFAADGSVQRAGFDFHVRCETTTRNTYEGLVRLNSYAPEQFEFPRALAGHDRLLYAGEPGFLNGVRSRSPDHSIREFHWRQIAGPAVSIDDANSAIAKVTALASIGQPEVVSFRLDVTDQDGRVSSDMVNLTVVPTSAPRTFVHIQGDASTFIGRGETAYLRDGQDTSLQTIVRLLGSAPDARDDFTVRDEDLRSWSVSLGSGVDGMFQPGYMSETFNDPEDILPQLSVTNSGRACNRPAGNLHVLDVSRDTDSLIDSFAVDFDLICQFETGAIRGSVRYNSTVPNSYTLLSADAGPDIVVLEGDTVELFDSSGTDIASLWVQVHGPETRLTDAGSKRAYFVPPTIPAGESRYFVFRLVNQRDDGAVGTDYVVVRVNDNGRTDWDAADFDKYVDKPHAYVAGNGQRFGIRQTNPLGNFAKVAFGAEAVSGMQIGDLVVNAVIFPVTDVVYRGIGFPTIEYFTRGTVADDYTLIIKDVNNQWQVEGGLSTGDGLFEDGEWTRVRTTIPAQSSTGTVYDRDELDESMTVRVAMVRLGPRSSAPPPDGDSPGGSGGGSFTWFLLAGLLSISGFRFFSNRRVARFQ